LARSRLPASAGRSVRGVVSGDKADAIGNKPETAATASQTRGGPTEQRSRNLSNATPPQSNAATPAPKRRWRRHRDSLDPCGLNLGTV
jgi:hypothetical protein